MNLCKEHWILWLVATSITLSYSGDKGMQKLIVTSTAFENSSEIPTKYTCDGADISPPLAWSNVPAKSLVVIVDDPDAPGKTWVHWVAYDIPSHIDSIAAAMPRNETLNVGGTQGRNDFEKTGYGGPCPPNGTHRYFFKVYALDKELNFPAGKTKTEVEKAMDGHILAYGELMGTYRRP